MLGVVLNPQIQSLVDFNLRSKSVLIFDLAAETEVSAPKMTTQGANHPFAKLTVKSCGKPPTAGGIREEPYSELLEKKVHLQTRLLQGGDQTCEKRCQSRNARDCFGHAARVVNGISPA